MRRDDRLGYQFREPKKRLILLGGISLQLLGERERLQAWLGRNATANLYICYADLPLTPATVPRKVAIQAAHSADVETSPPRAQQDNGLSAPNAFAVLDEMIAGREFERWSDELEPNIRERCSVIAIRPPHRTFFHTHVVVADDELFAAPLTDDLVEASQVKIPQEARELRDAVLEYMEGLLTSATEDSIGRLHNILSVVGELRQSVTEV